VLIYNIERLTIVRRRAPAEIADIDVIDYPGRDSGRRRFNRVDHSVHHGQDVD